MTAVALLALLSLAPAARPLEAALAEIAEARVTKKRPVVVFDLDSTLFDNGPRTRRILLEVAHLEPGLAKYAEAIRHLPDRLPYLVTDILAKAGVTDDADVARFVAGWKTRFFTDAYCAFDEPLAGAVEYVRAAQARGAAIVYLTGRDAPNMSSGTTDSLRRFGFPVGTPGAVLMMKPRFALEDEPFKAEAVAMVDRLGTVIATFENEPKNANLFRRTWPSARTFFLTTNSNPKKKVPLASGILKIPDFR